MVRVLQYGLSPIVGGIETYLYSLVMSAEMKEVAFDFLLDSDDEPAFYNQLLQRGCKFFSTTPRSRNPLANARELNQLFAGGGYNVFHNHLSSLSYMAPARAATAKGVPTLLHAHNASYSGNVLARLLHNANRRIFPFRRCTCIAVSDLAANWMFPEKVQVSVIHNGVDTSKFSYSEKSRMRLREEFGVAPQSPLVLHIGRFEFQKNHAFLLDVFAAFKAASPDARLLLVGDGALRQSVEDRAERLGIMASVCFAGRRSDISATLSAADALLFPSISEGFPMVLLEAQATGLPCLISDCITKEVIARDNVKTLSLRDPHQQWADALLQMVRKPLPRHMTAVALADKGLTLEQHTKAILGIYGALSSKV